MNAPVGAPDPQGSFEVALVRALFARLAESGVRFAVLRNYEGLPDSLGSRDLDLVVLPDQLGTAVATVVALAADLGLRIANHHGDERLTQFVLARRDADGRLLALTVDFFTGTQAYGVPLVGAEEMLADPADHRGIPVVRGRHVVLDRLLFNIFVGRPVPSRYDDRFVAVAAREGPALEAALASRLGAGPAARTAAAIARGETSRLPVWSRAARLSRLAVLLGRSGREGARLFAAFLRHRARAALVPHGEFVSVSGPDGSGKTTVIELALAELATLYRDAVTYRHFRPAVLPRLAVLARSAGSRAVPDEDYARPHRARPSGLAGSLARLGWYLADYALGYALLVRPWLYRRRTVVFDRYVFDLACDPGRSRIALGQRVLRQATRIVPRPHLAWFVHVRPEVAHARKAELDVPTISRLNDRYRALVRDGLLIEVGNEGRPEEAAARIVDAIVARREAKARARLGAPAA